MIKSSLITRVRDSVSPEYMMHLAYLMCDQPWSPKVIAAFEKEYGTTYLGSCTHGMVLMGAESAVRRYKADVAMFAIFMFREHFSYLKHQELSPMWQAVRAAVYGV